MLLNTDKTKFMMLGTKHKLKQVNNNVIIPTNRGSLNVVESDKLLGVYIDNTLAWKEHIGKLCKKISSLIYILRKNKHYLSIEQRNLFYKSYILSHIDYCSLVFCPSSPTLLDSLEKLQKRAARVILDMPYRTPSAQLYETLNWTNLTKRMQIKMGIMTYKSRNGLAPGYMKDMFTSVGVAHTRNLRSKTRNHLQLPRIKTEYGRKSFKYTAAQLWNSLPETITQSSTLLTFKSNIHEYITKL